VDRPKSKGLKKKIFFFQFNFLLHFGILQNEIVINTKNFDSKTTFLLHFGILQNEIVINTKKN